MQQFLAKAVAAPTQGWKLLSVGQRDRRGGVALMMAVLGGFLVGFAALAVDVGIWEGNASSMQGAADQAAIAASLALPTGSAAAQKEAKGLAAAYGFVDGIAGVSVAVNIPPTTGNYVSSANAIEVVIKQPQASFLSGAFLTSANTASARAVAAPTAPTAPTGPVPATCIVALAPTGESVVGSGASTIDAGTCNIYVNSTSACDLRLSGNAVMTGFDVFLGESNPGQGTCIIQNAKLTPTNKLNLSATSVADPYAQRTMPIPATPCKTVSPTATTLSPGTYCGLSLNGVQSLTLNDGVYIFDGGNVAVTQSAKLTGNNVTLVLTSSTSVYGAFTVSGTGNVTLTPWKSGPTAGMALWLDKKGARNLTVSGTGSFNVTGAIDAPASAVAWSGNASSPCTQLIASTINVSGAASFQHNCSGLGVSDVPGPTTSAAGYKLSE